MKCERGTFSYEEFSNEHNWMFRHILMHSSVGMHQPRGRDCTIIKLVIIKLVL